jgi:hypothetical protein
MVRVDGGGTRSGAMKGFEADICWFEQPASPATTMKRRAMRAQRLFG